MRGDEVRLRARRRRRRLQPRLPLPEVAGPASSSTTTPTGSRRRSCAATASWSRRAGRRRSRPSTAGSRRRARATAAATPSPSTSATPAPTASGPTLYGAPLLKALGTKNIYTASTVDQMPKQVSLGAHVRRRAQRPGPGRRPHRPPADPRRQPAGLQRLAADRARHARPPARDPRARRQGRGHRPAPQPHGQGGLRAPLHPPRHRRAPAVRDRQRAARRGARRPRPARRARQRRRRDRAPGAAVHARGRRAASCGIDADEIRRMARELAAAERAAVYARIGTTTQRFGTLASWLVDVLNYLTGNLDREGGAMFPLAAAGQRNSAGPGRLGQGLSDRPLGEPGQRPARGVRRAAGRRARGGDLDPRRGPGARAGDDRRQPAGLDPGLRGARGGGRRRSTSWSRSTSTSTRPPATPTSSSPPPSRWRRPTTTPRSTSSPCAASPTGRRR